VQEQFGIFPEINEPSKDKEKVKALDELFALSANYHKSSEFLALLKFVNKFPYLSPFNAFLVHMQDSGASVVLTHSKWKEYGRSVNPLARPFVILVPFGPVEFVYNITDTEPVDSPFDNTPEILINYFQTSGIFYNDIYKKTRNNAIKKEGIICSEQQMQMGGAGYATTNADNNYTVRINSNFGVNEKYSTLIHELAHIYCGHLGKLKESWWDARPGLSIAVKEIEAESVSFLVCQRFGLETTSKTYLSDYIKKNELLPNISMEKILTVSNYIESMGMSGFKTKNKMK
jgi:hypothetical protein